MEAVINKWGNSLGMRLPAKVAESVSLSAGSKVEITVNGDVIELKKVPEKKFSMAEFIAAADAEQAHKEEFDDSTVGGEVW